MGNHPTCSTSIPPEHPTSMETNKGMSALVGSSCEGALIQEIDTSELVHSMNAFLLEKVDLSLFRTYRNYLTKTMKQKSVHRTPQSLYTNLLLRKSNV